MRELTCASSSVAKPSSAEASGALASVPGLGALKWQADVALGAGLWVCSRVVAAFNIFCE
jgi:hypothetical protein